MRLSSTLTAARPHIGLKHGVIQPTRTEIVRMETVDSELPTPVGVGLDSVWGLTGGGCLGSGSDRVQVPSFVPVAPSHARKRMSLLRFVPDNDRPPRSAA